MARVSVFCLGMRRLSKSDGEEMDRIRGWEVVMRLEGLQRSGDEISESVLAWEGKDWVIMLPHDGIRSWNGSPTCCKNESEEREGEPR